MSINIFLTGNPGIGKTTIIQKFIRSYPLSMGGFYTHEIREHGIRVGFTIEAIRSWEQENQDDFEKKYLAIMAHVNCRSPYRVGRYGVNVSAIEEVGITALREGIRNAKTIIIDEIGRMELYSELFQKEVTNVIDCPLPVLGVIQMKQNPFLDSIRKRVDVTIIRVTPDNRDTLPMCLFEIFGSETDKTI